MNVTHESRYGMRDLIHLRIDIDRHEARAVLTRTGHINESGIGLGFLLRLLRT